MNLVVVRCRIIVSAKVSNDRRQHQGLEDVSRMNGQIDKVNIAYDTVVLCQHSRFALTVRWWNKNLIRFDV